MKILRHEKCISVTTAWQFLRLRLEKTASKRGRQL